MNHLTSNFFRQALELTYEMKQLDSEIHQNSRQIERINEHCESLQQRNQNLQQMEKDLKSLLEKFSEEEKIQKRAFNLDEQFGVEVHRKNMTEQQFMEQFMIYLPHDSLSEMQQYSETLDIKVAGKLYEEGKNHSKTMENLQKTKEKYHKIYDDKKAHIEELRQRMS